MFISLEGVDGSGKSTQAKLLAEALGPGTTLIREPGGTDAAERIRELLADPALALDPFAELLLFSAARADLLARVVRPALDAGGTVVADRFADSSVAYQGGARGLGASHVLSLVDQTIDGLWPDLTVLSADRPRGRAGAGRAARTASRPRGWSCSGPSPRRMTRSRVIASDRVVTVDAEGTVEEVHARVMERGS